MDKSNIILAMLSCGLGLVAILINDLLWGAGLILGAGLLLLFEYLRACPDKQAKV